MNTSKSQLYSVNLRNMNLSLMWWRDSARFSSFILGKNSKFDQSEHFEILEPIFRVICPP